MAQPVENPATMSGFEVQEVEFESKEARDAFVKEHVDYLEGVLRDRSDLEKQAKTSVLQYRSRIPQENLRPGDSELDLPFTKKLAIQSRSRMVNPTMAYENKFITVAKKEAFRELAKKYEDIATYVEDQVDWLWILNHGWQQAEVFPKTIAHVLWDREERIVKYRKTHEEPVLDEDGQPEMVESPDGPVPRMQDVTEIAERVVVDREGVKVEIVPWANVVHPVCERLKDADWIAKRFWETYKQAKAKQDRGVYDQDIELEKAASQEAPDDDFYLNAPPKKDSGNVQNRTKLRERFEIYTTFDDREVLMTIDWDTKTALRIVYNWNWEFPRAFFTMSYEEDLETVEGESLCVQLEPLHRAYSASFNQRLNGASRSLEKLILMPQGAGVEEWFKDNELRGGAFELNLDSDEMTGITTIDFGSSFSQLPELEQRIQQDAYDLSGIAQAFFGQEVANRPTAYGTGLVVEEAKQPLYTRLESMRRWMSEIFTCCFARYVQYYPEGMRVYMRAEAESGPGEAAATHYVMERSIPWADGYWGDYVYFETKVSSSTLNRATRRQEVLALIDKLPSIIGTMQELVQIIVAGGPDAPAAYKLLQLYQANVIEFAENFEVASGELADITQEVDLGQQIQESFNLLRAEIGLLQAQLQSALQGDTGPAEVGPQPSPQAAGA